MIVFTLGPGTYFTDGSKLYPDPRRREVGCGFCSVTADLQLRTGAYGPDTLDNATVPVAELLAVIILVERSVGPINIHSDCKFVCACFNKFAQRTIRGAHVTLWTRLQRNGRDFLVQRFVCTCALAPTVMLTDDGSPTWLQGLKK